jgi:hypothetical protein
MKIISHTISPTSFTLKPICSNKMGLFKCKNHPLGHAQIILTHILKNSYNITLFKRNPNRHDWVGCIEKLVYLM